MAKRVLACAHQLQEGDVVEPLRNVPILRDLAVDMGKAYAMNAKAKAHQSSFVQDVMLGVEDEEKPLKATAFSAVHLIVHVLFMP